MSERYSAADYRWQVVEGASALRYYRRGCAVRMTFRPDGKWSLEPVERRAFSWTAQAESQREQKPGLRPQAPAKPNA